MPLSNPWHLPAVLRYLAAINPTRVLDVGVGMGTYGFMIRQHMDIAHERLARSAWRLTIDGIEIFEPYRNPIWEFAYNSVQIGDARQLLPFCGQYDVVVCNDVLEHFPKAEAVRMAVEMLKHAPVVIATTPNYDCPQGNWGGNEAETHRCLLTAGDLPNVVVERQTTVTACFVLSSAAEQIRLLKEADLHSPQISPPRAWSLSHRLQAKTRKLLGWG